MRASGGTGDFKAKAIAGTHTVLIALDCPEARRKGLMGFAFQRGSWSEQPAEVPALAEGVQVGRSRSEERPSTRPIRASRRPFYTDEFPVQSFLWGDYGGLARHALPLRRAADVRQARCAHHRPGDEIEFDITTEQEWGDGETHGVWFNRGAIASQKFAEEFGNKPPQEHQRSQRSDRRMAVARASGSLPRAISTRRRPGDALRVAAYEFTYPPILNALKELIDQGIDVQIVYHDTTDANGEPNEAAMEAAGLPVNDQKITYRRSLTKIPHNKFIVRLKGGTEPVEVWTGSTNFTPSGFLGQTNVGHRVADAETTAEQLSGILGAGEDRSGPRRRPARGRPN